MYCAVLDADDLVNRLRVSADLEAPERNQSDVLARSATSHPCYFRSDTRGPSFISANSDRNRMGTGVEMVCQVLDCMQHAFRMEWDPQSIDARVRKMFFPTYIGGAARKILG